MLQNVGIIADNRLEASFILVPREGEEKLLSTIPVPALNQHSTQPTPVHMSTIEGYVPGSTPHTSAHHWGSNSESEPELSISGKYFVDSWGRVCLPRGVNLSGCSKLPTNHDENVFPKNQKDVTFVGRPFPLDDAPEHFARLRRWGLTLVRLLVTWEALEHSGPGQYDTSYLSYLTSLISLMPSFGITCIVSLHQDVWSRYTGGSGAPAWTIEAVGFDLSKLEETGAAYLGGVNVPGVEHVKGRWPTGYLKLASATMWTCFFAGDIFAPKLRVTHPKSGQDMSIQTFLQSTFLDCFGVLAKTLGCIPGVLGFECLNEPHFGYINLPSLHEFNYYTELHFHDTPSALQSFALGSGHTLSIPHYVRSFPFPTRISHHVPVNTSKTSVWLKDGPTRGECIWEMHGVWGWDTNKGAPVALRESYFTKHPVTGEKIDFYKDCWYPLIAKWADVVHAHSGGKKLVFVEPIPNEFCPSSWTPEHRPRNMVFSPHWYDLQSLFTKSFGSLSVNVQGLSRGLFLLRGMYWGHRGARTNYHLQISTLVNEAYTSLNDNVPVLIGECGIPMDMNNAEAFRTGNFVWQERAMDALMHALERTLVGFTLWNYNPENKDVEGDYWNGENFSWFSQSRARSKLPNSSLSQDDASLDSGGRLLSVVKRPYPAKVAGLPVAFNYDSDTGAFSFSYRNPSSPAFDSHSSAESKHSTPIELKCRETEIFVPSALVQGRRMIITASVKAENFTYDHIRQTLFVVHKETAPDALHEVHVAFDPPIQGRLARRVIIGGRTLILAALLILLFSFVVQKAMLQRTA